MNPIAFITIASTVRRSLKGNLTQCLTFKRHHTSNNRSTHLKDWGKGHITFLWLDDHLLIVWENAFYRWSEIREQQRQNDIRAVKTRHKMGATATQGQATKIRYKWNASLETAKASEELRQLRAVGQVLRLLAPRFFFQIYPNLSAVPIGYSALSIFSIFSALSIFSMLVYNSGSLFSINYI